jgi:hypothetical protein
MNLLQAPMIFAALLLSLATSALAQGASHGGQAVTEAGQASGHASASAAHSIVASGQVTSAALAVPLMSGAVVAGSVGNASGTAADSMLQAANAPIGTPLPVSTETVTVLPPDVALKSRAVKP